MATAEGSPCNETSSITKIAGAPPVGIVHTCTADGGKLRLKNCCLWIGQFDRCMPLASKEELLSRLEREGQENADANALCLLAGLSVSEIPPQEVLECLRRFDSDQLSQANGRDIRP